MASAALSVKRRRDWQKLGLACAAAAEAVALILLLAPFPQPTQPAQLPAAIIFWLESTSGNRSSGWTYLIRTSVVMDFESPRPILWGYVAIRLENATTGGPYPVPPGTTLRVFPSSGWVPPPFGPMVAECNISTGVWVAGAMAPVETGQWVLLQGAIPPDTYLGNGTWTNVGAILAFDYISSGQRIDFNVPLQG